MTGTADLPRSKPAGRAAGTQLYFTGKPCRRGHVEPRYTRSGQCLVCAVICRRVWADENRDRKNELHRLWCQANPERRKAHKSKKIRPETKRAWHLANIEKVRASYRRYYERNKGYFKTKCRNRYAMHASAEGTHTEEDVADLLTAQRGKCAYCRTSFGPKYHVDHIVALSRGGSNDRANLQILCSFCNLSKGAKHPGDFARERGLLL